MRVTNSGAFWAIWILQFKAILYFLFTFGSITTLITVNGKIILLIQGSGNEVKIWKLSLSDV